MYYYNTNIKMFRLSGRVCFTLKQGFGCLVQQDLPERLQNSTYISKMIPLFCNAIKMDVYLTVVQC